MEAGSRKRRKCKRPSNSSPALPATVRALLHSTQRCPGHPVPSVTSESTVPDRVTVCSVLGTRISIHFRKSVVVGPFYHSEQAVLLVRGPGQQISKNSSYLWPFLATWQVNYESFPSDSTHRSEKTETQSEALARNFLLCRNKNRAFKTNSITLQNLKTYLETLAHHVLVKQVRRSWAEKGWTRARFPSLLDPRSSLNSIVCVQHLFWCRPCCSYAWFLCNIIDGVKRYFSCQVKILSHSGCINSNRSFLKRCKVRKAQRWILSENYTYAIHI